MSLKRVILPELLLNKRGDKNLRQFLSQLYSCYSTDLDENGVIRVKETKKPAYDSRYTTFLKNLVNHEQKSQYLQLFLFSLSKLKSNRNRPIYITKELTKDLLTINKSMDTSYLPNGFFNYIVFPTNTFHYYTMDNGKSSYLDGMFINYLKDDELLMIQPFSTREDNVLLPVFYNSSTKVKNGSNIEDSFNEFWSEIDIAKTRNTQNERNENIKLLKLAYNLMLFIENKCGLELNYPISKASKTEKRNSDLLEKENHCTIPLTRIGHNLHDGLKYSKESTNVSGHFRWQPYGKELKELKLIWIEPHERKFKNLKKT